MTVAEWTLAGRYRIQERLGSGGTADVFRAHDEHLDRDVAVKVFRTAPSDDDAMFSATRREAELQSLARLNHPNLIRLLDGAVGTDEPAYLVLDLVCGPDLATRLQDGPMPEHEVRSIGRQIADALGYAHAQGMVHRDVKPANILLGADGPDGTAWARLSDFGTVRMIDGARVTAADLTLGTVSYIAPEQARGADVGPAADIYSLGLILLEALTGQRCFEGATPEALLARLATTPTIPDWLPDDLQALIHAMTAVDPADRPTADAVAESLQASVPPEVAAAADAEETTSMRAVVAAPVGAELAGDDELPPPVVEPPGSQVPRGRRSRVLFALAALAFAAVLVGAAFLIMGSTTPSEGDTPTGGHPATHSDSPSTSAHRSASHRAGQQIVAPPTTQSVGHSQSASQQPTHTQPTTPQQTTQAPATTSAAPTTSAPPTATTSAPPPSTSAAPTTADATSAADQTTQAIAPSP